MRILVVLAVMGVCSASYQANNNGYGHGHDHGHGHYSGYVQPKWTGPVASTIPAGVGGKIIPVSDTYEVTAARKEFFRAYNDQLAKVSSLRYGTPNHGRPYGHGGPIHAPVNHYSVPAPAHFYSAPAHYHGGSVHSHGAAAAGHAPVPVRDTPEVAAAKAQFFRIFQEQAAAAAAAPDHYTKHSFH